MFKSVALNVYLWSIAWMVIPTILVEAQTVPLSEPLSYTYIRKPNVAPDYLDVSRIAKVNTHFGNIYFGFFTNAAPEHVENFIKLAQSKFYNGTLFHYVIDNYLIQGGDPLSKGESHKRQFGSGGPGYQLVAELSQLKSVRGMVSMAHYADDINSAGSQFFISLDNIPELDQKYTIFGYVISGMDVAQKISEQGVDKAYFPLKDISMRVDILDSPLIKDFTYPDSAQGNGRFTANPPSNPYNPYRNAPNVSLIQELEAALVAARKKDMDKLNIHYKNIGDLIKYQVGSPKERTSRIPNIGKLSPPAGAQQKFATKPVPTIKLEILNSQRISINERVVSFELKTLSQYLSPWHRRYPQSVYFIKQYSNVDQKLIKLLYSQLQQLGIRNIKLEF